MSTTGRRYQGRLPRTDGARAYFLMLSTIVTPGLPVGSQQNPKICTRKECVSLPTVELCHPSDCRSAYSSLGEIPVARVVYTLHAEERNGGSRSHPFQPINPVTAFRHSSLSPPHPASWILKLDTIENAFIIKRGASRRPADHDRDGREGRQFRLDNIAGRSGRPN